MTAGTLRQWSGLSAATVNALALANRPGCRVELLAGWQVRSLAAAGFLEGYTLNAAAREAWAKLQRGERVR